MIKRIKNFIQKLQNSDEVVKKRWLFGATIISMLLVTALWSVYISYSVKNLNTAETKKTNDLSFSAVFNTGLKILGEETVETIKALFNGPESSIVLEKNFDFTLDALEEIQPKQLP